MEVVNTFIEDLKKHGVGRRAPDDVFFKDNKLYPQLAKRLGLTDIDDEELCHKQMDITCEIPGCVTKFTTVMDYESHYNKVHRYKCQECKKILPSPHLLDLHIAEHHDSFFAVLAERGAAFCCYVEQCSIKFLDPEERRKHCIDVHKFPTDFRFDQQKKQQQNKRKNKHPKKRTVNSDEQMVIDENINSNEASCSSSLNSVKNVAAPVIKNFSFGHAKNRGFSKSTYTGKTFTNDNNNSITNKNLPEKSALDSEDMFVDLIANLPDC